MLRNNAEAMRLKNLKSFYTKGVTHENKKQN
jgi:hypothetical protein